MDDKQRHVLVGWCAIPAIIVLGFILTITSAFGLAANYDRSVANVLLSEGGYSNDASDPGGPTKYGITIYDVRAYIKKGATAADVRRLTKDQALEIYHSKYWNHPCVRGDELPVGLDYTIFDYAVNSGVGRAGKKLKSILHLASNSCNITDDVLARVKERPVGDLIDGVNDERMAFLRSLGTYRVFGLGWKRRVTSVRSISRQMAGLGSKGFLNEFLMPAYGPGKGVENAEDLMVP